MDVDPVREPMEASEYLAEVARLSAYLRGAAAAGTEAEALARITALEELSGTLSAAQSAEAVAFADLRRDRDRLNGLPVQEWGVRAGDEVGLAKRVSPGSGRKFISAARAIVTEMPETYTALSSGEISIEKARIMVDETASLAPADRSRVDARMRGSLGQSGPRSLRTEVRAMAMQVDGADAERKAREAAAHRRVTLTTLEDGMGRVSAILPLPEAVAVWTGLKEAADSAIAAGDAGGRRQPQVMTDTFVERLTGQGSAQAVPSQVHLVIEAESLFADGMVPAWMPGFGPLPAATARSFLAANEAEVFIRRMFTTVTEGQLVGTEARGRAFTGRLREMVIFRDDRCRTPWCDAPIKHADHAKPFAEGGATSWENGSGLCASCNYAKEHPGWSHEASAAGLTVTTPSGRKYSSTTPPFVKRMKYPRRPVGSGDVVGGGAVGGSAVGGSAGGAADPPPSDWRRQLASLLEVSTTPPRGSPAPARDSEPARDSAFGSEEPSSDSVPGSKEPQASDSETVSPPAVPRAEQHVGLDAETVTIPPDLRVVVAAPESPGRRGGVAPVSTRGPLESLRRLRTESAAEQVLLAGLLEGAG
ncbi:MULTISPECIES: HNH endonuclease [Brevibacterium]|uniref:HNH nuclease domain-containing protein n=2 Tax=Brevibacterium TaxID=1696 RepID=A0ABP9U509_9MICO